MVSDVAALFIDPRGQYPKMPGVDCWDEARDARLYTGPHPVVAHPPCARWSRLAESVYARTRKEAHRPGNDQGCFASALASVRKFGGVLEHPACSKAWEAYGLRVPHSYQWTGFFWTANPYDFSDYQVCEVWQSAYGHPAPKRTWLLYVGSRPPFELRWDRPAGTHAVAGDSRKRRAQGAAARPRLTGKQNLATPTAFAEELVRLARWS